MYLIVGLGNPGKEYDKTRHNIGYMMIDGIANSRNIKFNHEKFGGIYAEDRINNEKIILLKPEKYINLSGEVIKDYVDYFKIPIENILIINDDMDLEIGAFKLREQGGSAKDKNIEKKDYVLGHLSQEDLLKLENTKEEIKKIYIDFFEMSFSNLMNKYNIGKWYNVWKNFYDWFIKSKCCNTK